MAITLVATAGSASANSYALLADANTYFASRPGSDTWTSAGDEDKKAALIGATNRLEQEVYRGTRVTETQALAWPRAYLSYDGYDLDDTTVPVFVQRACFEEALALLTDPTKYAPTGLEAFTSLSVGPVAMQLRDSVHTPSALSPAAASLLRDYRLTSSGSFRVVR